MLLVSRRYGCGVYYVRDLRATNGLCVLAEHRRIGHGGTLRSHHLGDNATTTTKMCIGYQNRILGDRQNWSGVINIKVLEKFGACSLIRVPARLDIEITMTWSTTEIHSLAQCERNSPRPILQKLATQPDQGLKQISRPSHSQRRIIRIKHPILKSPSCEIVKIEQRSIDQI